MSDLIVLNIPVKPYLEKYLIKKYGPTHKATRRSWLGGYILDLLTSEYKKEKGDLKNDAFYPVRLTATVIKERGFTISPLKLKHLANQIYQVFKSDLYSYIEVSIGNELKFYNEDHDSINKQNVIRAIAQFLNFYDISEDDINSDSIYRQFSRESKTDSLETVKK